MRKNIHPEYREVVFQDVSAGENFITKSTVFSKDTIELDGKEYPLVKLAISSASHPFFTGKQKFVDTAGRIEKFQRRYKIDDAKGTGSVLKPGGKKPAKAVAAEPAAKADVKADKKADTKADAKADTKADVKVDTKAEASADA